MQAIYGFEQIREAIYNLALDRIAERFLPDLNSMEVQDPVRLAADREASILLFKNYYQKQNLAGVSDVTPKVRQAAVDSINYYHNQLHKEYEHAVRNLLRETEKIYDRYLLVLRLPVELADFVDIDFHERQKRQIIPVPVLEHEQKFYYNSLIARLREHRMLNNETDKRGLRWDRDLIRQWYKILQKDETYLLYQRLAEADLEKDQTIVDYVLRNFVLKNDAVVSFFEEEDINWEENQSVVKNMAIKTLKALCEAQPGEEVELYPLSVNWEEDREFFKELFKKTIENDEEYELVIAEKIKNWDIERVTSIDKIILKMASCEMLNFPSIPVKVSINEYIELAKGYSTPRSRQFINGVLDVVSAELLQQGKIKKSGRGLLDNK